jgi:hypothetical protein
VAVFGVVISPPLESVFEEWHSFDGMLRRTVDCRKCERADPVVNSDVGCLQMRSVLIPM